MIATDDFRTVEINSAEDLRAWLSANHAQENAVWLVTWKKSHPERYVSTGDVLDELVAFGWIDGIRRKLDDDRTMQLISPRRTQHWAKSYKDRVARLLAEGRMAPPGLACVDQAKKNGLWDFMDDVDALIVPGDLAGALATRPAASEAFEAAPPSYRRNLLRWVKLAKTEPTRRKRIAEVVSASAENRRIPQM